MKQISHFISPSISFLHSFNFLSAIFERFPGTIESLFKMAERGAICPQRLRGLKLKIVDILTAGNALNCIVSQSKGRDLKKFLLASLAGGPHFAFFVPRSRKALGCPGCGPQFFSETERPSSCSKDSRASANMIW